MNNNPFILCFIKDNFAYFTNQKLEDQWGDDWNNAPYEHNAGKPIISNNCEIIKIAFESELVQPCELYTNSPYSVEDINSLKTPWLRSYNISEVPHIVIYAGTTLKNFKELIKSNGGKIYVEEK